MMKDRSWWFELFGKTLRNISVAGVLISGGLSPVSFVYAGIGFLVSTCIWFAARGVAKCCCEEDSSTVASPSPDAMTEYEDCENGGDSLDERQGYCIHEGKLQLYAYSRAAGTKSEIRDTKLQGDCSLYKGDDMLGMVRSTIHGRCNLKV